MNDINNKIARFWLVKRLETAILSNGERDDFSFLVVEDDFSRNERSEFLS